MGDEQPDILENVRDEGTIDRFDVDNCFYCLAYLVEEAPKLKWTDLKVGDVIRDLKDDSVSMVTRIDSKDTELQFMQALCGLTMKTSKIVRKYNNHIATSV